VVSHPRRKYASVSLCSRKHRKLLFHSGPFSHLSSHSEPSTRYHLVRHSPVVEPFQVTVLAVWTNHSPTYGHEKNVKSDGGGIQDTIDCVLYTPDLITQHPVGDESKVENSEVQCRIVVVHISDTGHGDKWQVV
jgi:hypothetical protein